MKKLLVISGMLSLLLFMPRPMYANESLPNSLAVAVPVPVISISPSPSPYPQLDDASNANLILTTVKTMFTNLDNFAGGFTFTTPNVFNSSITFMDGAEIGGLGTVRIGFTVISIIIGLGLIGWKAMKSSVAIDGAFLSKLIPRLVIYALSLLILPYVLSKSIDAINVLNDTIMHIPFVNEEGLTSFIIDFYSQTQQKISSGTPASDFWISNATVFDLLHSIQNILLLNLFFLITIIALLFGTVFLLLQCAMRFISILFLSLIYPLVIPFILTEETEKTFTGFLRIWVTFLLHQPAFCLGYVLIMYIVRSILSSNGPSMGLLFLYIACLFFLGTVNILVARIFADATVAVASNAEAGIANALTGVAVAKSLNAGNKASGWIKNKYNEWKNRTQVINPDFKKRAGGFTWTGKMWDVYLAYDKGLYPSGLPEGRNHALNTGIIGGKDVIYGNPPKSSVIDSSGEQAGIFTKTPQITNIPMAQNIRSRGIVITPLDSNKGLLSVTGNGYAHTNPTTQLKTVYLSQKDAKTAGITKNQLEPVSFNKMKIADISRYQRGTSLSSEKIASYMRIHEQRFKKQDIQGIFTKHYDNIGNKRVNVPRIILKG